MIKRCLITLWVLAISTSATASQRATTPQAGSELSQSHTIWVAEVLKRMQTVKVGMTRSELLLVFTTEGGLSTPLQRTYVSRDCPFFKVNAEHQDFAAVPAGQHHGLEQLELELTKLPRNEMKNAGTLSEA